MPAEIRLAHEFYKLNFSDDIKTAHIVLFFYAETF
jgi:hypothetical protein